MKRKGERSVKKQDSLSCRLFESSAARSPLPVALFDARLLADLGGVRGGLVTVTVAKRSQALWCYTIAPEQVREDPGPKLFVSRRTRTKLGADIGMPTSAANDNQADILQALIALGYSDRDAALALKALPQDCGVSEGIKLALKALAK